MKLSHTLRRAAGTVLAFLPSELSASALLRPSESQLTLAGDFFYTPSDFNPISRLDLFTGAYERDEIALLSRLNPVNVMIELGANIGVVARQAFKHLNPGGLYVAVEANPDSITPLVHNMQLTEQIYNDGRKAIVVNAAVVEPALAGRKAPFVVKRNLSSALLGDADVDTPLKRKQRIEQVSTTTLTTLLQHYAPAERDIALICDIEGAEKFLYEKEGAALKRIPQIIVELHDPHISGFTETANDMLRGFEKQGFRSVASLRHGTCRYLRQEVA